MSDSKPIAPQPPLPPNQLVDALAMWDAETPTAAACGLSVIRIDKNERLLVPFTTTMTRIDLHYIDYPSMRGFVPCLGDGCMLCRIGQQAEVRDLWPVYDPIAQTIGVLPISPNQRPQALRPQLAPILRQLKAEGGLTSQLALRQVDGYRYRLATLPLPDDADDGADTILAFKKQLEAGAIDLTAVYHRLTNEELMEIPEVAKAMKRRSIKL